MKKFVFLFFIIPLFSSCNPYGEKSRIYSVFGKNTILVPFSVQIEQSSHQEDPAFSLPIVFDVTLENESSSLKSEDISFSGSANIEKFEVSGSGKNYKIKVWGLSLLGSGTIIPYIKANTFEDNYENPNKASTSVDNSVSIVGPVLSVSCAYKHTCALLSSGTVECFGDNTYGQITIPSLYSIPGMVRDVAVSGHSTNAHTCLTLSGGSSVCFGQITSTGSLNNDDHVSFIDAGSYNICSLLEDLTPLCWGDNSFGQSTIPTALQGANGMSQISSGALHTCGVSSDGIAYCWGANDSRVTGIPASLLSSGDAKMVVAGNTHSCGLGTDGTVECWGLGPLGQTTVPASLQITDSTSKITTSYNHNCAITSDNAVVCWGHDSWGQSTPSSEVDDPDEAINVCTGNTHSCAVTSLGKLSCWGSNTSGESTVPSNL